MDREVFGRGMAILTGCYPDYDLKDETTGLYWQFLQNLKNHEFERAIKDHISKAKWFPKISEIMDAIKSQRPSAQLQWTRLLTAASETGEKPEVDAATDKALAAVGGFNRVGLASFDDLPFIFKEFERAYREAMDLEMEAQLAIDARPVPKLEG